MIRAFLLALSILPAAAAQASAQEPSLLGAFSDWKAFTFQENGQKGCFVYSTPTASEAGNVARGAVYVMVTHRPWTQTYDEVSFNSGYPFKTDSSPTLQIGAESTEMFAEGEGAWFKTPEQDRSGVKAMIRGRDMRIGGVSQRDAKTIDIFSLTGFTAAYKTASKACGVER